MTPKFLPISCCVIAKPVLTLAVAIRTPKQQMQHFFIRVGAVARLLLSQFPLRPITNATLEGKRKSKNHRFWRLFCPLFQLLGKVGRRRHIPYAKESTERKLPAGGKKEKLLTKSMPPAGKQKTAIERTHLTGGKKSTATAAISIRMRHQPPRRFGTADA